jgi:hypothetical protein
MLCYGLAYLNSLLFNHRGHRGGMELHRDHHPLIHLSVIDALI